MKLASPLNSERLDQLLSLAGIASEFIEFSGNRAIISQSSRLHVLTAMGLCPASEEELEQALISRELAPLRNWVVPVQLTSLDGLSIQLSFTPEQEDWTFNWQLELENGECLSGELVPSSLPTSSQHAVGGQRYLRKELVLDGIGMGYHQFTISHGGASCNALVIASPPQTWQPPFLNEGGRGWGLSVQLYSVRSEQNWGMGDFADLEQLVQLAASRGADFVLLNPLHALDPRYPENASPYSPSDRRYLNPLYIAPQWCPEFTAESVQQHFSSPAFTAALQQSHDLALVDYSLVNRLKYAVLGLMFEEFQQDRGKRKRAFNAFVVEDGESLLAFASFQAERCQYPERLAGNVRFQLYLQWLAREQVERCQQAAIQAGMQLGLIRDLAVGSSVDGCEVVNNETLFCLDARIGAPPDNFNPDGQNWGLPPLHPLALEENCYAHFIDLLRANMRSCGALRIDHVMSLMRLWWCPLDGTNATGAYVHYPVEMLFGILRLESVRHQCAVIGEDLGVVPPEIRGYLDDGGLYSNCVFYFEKYDGWSFRKPWDYKPQALAMIANHDTATLKAWWNCSDLELRYRIGLIPDAEKLAAERHWRLGEKGQLLVWLQEQGQLPPGWDVAQVDRQLDDELKIALIRGCSAIASRLVSLQLDDLADAEDPVNIPGTSTEYANWRRKLPLDLGDIFASETTAVMLSILTETRTHAG